MIRVGKATARCPVCGGSGRAVVPRVRRGDTITSQPCGACRGLGVILQAADSRDEPTA